MTKELLAAALIIGVGLCVSGAGTHFYQWLTRQQAMLRLDGPTYWAAMGNMAMSFFCGPYIMLQLGWRNEGEGVMSMTSVLLSSLVAFGWAFITGLLVMSLYVALPFF